MANIHPRQRTTAVVDLRQENKDLKEENERWKEMVLQDVPGLLISMRKIIDAAAVPTRSGSEMTIPPQTLPSPQPPSAPGLHLLRQSSPPVHQCPALNRQKLRSIRAVVCW